MKASVARLVAVSFIAVSGFSTPVVVPDFPVPPEQGKPWTARGGVITSNLESATEALFAIGFPDPRGCEYREIQIKVSSVWSGDPQLVSIRGWVLPATTPNADRYAICWNGLIYQTVNVGALADLHTDATALIPPNSRRFNPGLGEIRSVFASNSPSSRVLLLLHSGEMETAVKNWVPDEQFMTQAQIASKRPESEIGNKRNYDPYLELAQDWAWAQFDRVLCAHMRGDVALALAGARKLTEAQPKIESEAERRGFAHPGYSDSLKHEKPRAYLHFLDQLPQILSDLERRARNPKQTTIINTGLTNISDPGRRVSALIEDLDMVCARQWGQPGMVMPEEDPIVQALINARDAAVEPLIECLDKDKRLTRSVGFSRDFQRNRVVISTPSAARAALQQILKVQFRTSSEFRAYWRENKAVKLEDRWYATLKNDNAAIEQWLQAARNVVQPDNVTGVAGSGHYTTVPPDPSRKPSFRGEILRTKQSPSVSELLVKRAESMAQRAQKQDQFMGVEALRHGTELVTILAEWDKPALAAAPARPMMQRGIELFAEPNSFIMSSGHDLARYVPRLTQLRVNGGDRHALAEYAAWIKSADAQKLDSYALDAFEPLWRSPEDPSVVSIADWLFNDPTSPWSTLPWKRAGFRNPIESDLIKVPGFRRLVLRELDNRDLAGTLEWRSPNLVNYDLKDIGRGSRSSPWPETERPEDGKKIEIRRCDWVAWCLWNGKRIPSFNPFATTEARNEAIQKAKALLSQSGGTPGPE